MRELAEIYVGGKWLPSAGAGRIEVINPATEQVIATVPEGAAADVDLAVQAARDALPAWSALPVAERADWLDKISAALAARQDELGALVCSDMGMPLELAKAIQIGLPSLTFSLYAGATREFDFDGREIGNSLIVREPIGVVGCITPWNFPLQQIVQKIGGALGAGCTVVVKPSEVAPLVSFELARIVDELGLPAGVFNLVCGSGPIVGEAIATHPDIDMVTFTGSTRTGRRISELAAPTIKRVALELGGKSANVILDDADLEAAVTDGVAKCYLNSGQTCSALTRMLVPAARLAEAEQYAAAAAQGFVAGDPLDPTSQLGPIVSAPQLQKVRDYIGAGLADGAKLLTGGVEHPSETGYFVPATVFSEVGEHMSIAKEEIFGPVLVLIPYDDEADAVRIANDTVYGLAAGVWSGDADRAMKVARQLRAGQVEVNGGAFNPAAPFGGYKQSGNGREGGIFGLEEFLETKAIQR